MTTGDAGPASTPVVVHVAPAGNAFMADIAHWLAEAARCGGRPATVSSDGTLPPPPGEALSLVVAPHEFYGLSDRPVRERRRAAAHSIPVATEQPGTTWFDESLRWCELAPWCLDINDVAVDAARTAGVDARLLRLGAVPSMDHRSTAPRTVDLTVLAGLTDRRAARLAAAAPLLWPRTSQLRLFPTDRPVVASPGGAGGSGPLFGADKYELLARTKILVNLHRDDGTAYFEWARAVEAMANGCVVVTEPSGATGPLVDGTHLVVDDDPLARAVSLLDDSDELGRIGDAAADLVHGDLALDRTIGPLLDAAEGAVASAPAPRPLVGPRLASRRGRRSTAARPPFRPHREIRRRLLDAVVAERALRREIDAARCRLRHGSRDHLTVVDTPAWERGGADVSVIVTLFDYADLVRETLDSIVASVGVDAEVVVVDDHSTDDGRAVVEAWMAQREQVPVRLLAGDANRGLAAARNLAIGHTRTDRVMIMDADNLVRPTCLQRLSAALDDDPAAAFSWAILERFGDDTGVLSAFAWDPDRLAERNQIDAQVMLRRSTWERFDGYRELPGLLAGWEDWDLWLRIAAAGGHGVLVPELLGRYRVQGTSMVSGPTRFNDVMLERFEALHPSTSFPAR